MGYQLTGEQTSNSDKIELGVYASKVKVISIEDFSNYPGQKEKKTIGKNGFEPEICLAVTVDNGAREKKMTFFGKFKKDNVSGKVTGWDHFNNDVERFLLTAAGMQLEINDDFSIPAWLLQKFIGAEFVAVRYCSGTYTDGSDGQEKPSYNDWSKVFSKQSTPDQISVEWSRSKQYVKNFHPEIQEAWEKKKVKENAEFKADNTAVDEGPLF